MLLGSDYSMRFILLRLRRPFWLSSAEQPFVCRLKNRAERGHQLGEWVLHAEQRKARWFLRRRSGGLRGPTVIVMRGVKMSGWMSRSGKRSLCGRRRLMFHPMRIVFIALMLFNPRFRGEQVSVVQLIRVRLMRKRITRPCSRHNRR